MPRRKQITTFRQHGTASKVEIFEELIQKVLGVNVKLAPEKKEDYAAKHKMCRREAGG